MRRYVKSFGIIWGALLVLGAAGAARADGWCYKHVRHQQHELDEAIHDHGYRSWQADRERRKLDQIRGECRYHADRDREHDRDYDNYNHYR
jgi:hypothetical protein